MGYPSDEQAPDNRMQLVLEDGSSFGGRCCAADSPAVGEVVFNTAMVGYPQALTDPSYAGQILVQSYPLIGNYGAPDPAAAGVDRALQSSRIQVQGLVVQQESSHYNHHLAGRSLSEWLRAENVPMLAGVDTRRLTRTLRERGVMRGWLFPHTMTFDEARRTATPVDMQREVFRKVVADEPIHYAGGELRVLVIDIGVKDGLIDCLLERGASVTRAPWFGPIEELARGADGVLVGNGPGDPADLDALTSRVRTIMSGAAKPIFGVCLGHQILARAAGCATYKLPYGHRGINQPVQDIATGRCFVTSQNHGYAVDARSLPPGLSEWFVNLNDRTNEGLRWRDRPIFSVQFHPEARPGPSDTEFLFDDFLRAAGAQRVAWSA